ncbi:MAG TPA: TspO/MBR family protein [Patescibacteria group bacterium]|nr:TspO/MBR family protein [Patescibacteria group bacterium]
MLTSWNWQDWYQALVKPSWTPTSGTISTIWTILYPLILITFTVIFYRLIKKEIVLIVALPFIINLIANFAFTPILFGLKNLPLASFDILVVWLTIVWGMVAIFPHSKILAFLQIPYLIWVSIATFLQLSITLMNR